jgi:hypothetical protein
LISGVILELAELDRARFGEAEGLLSDTGDEVSFLARGRLGGVVALLMSLLLLGGVGDSASLLTGMLGFLVTYSIRGE